LWPPFAGPLAGNEFPRRRLFADVQRDEWDLVIGSGAVLITNIYSDMLNYLQIKGLLGPACCIRGRPQYAGHKRTIIADNMERPCDTMEFNSM